jgi:hypothetical protein
MAILESEDKEKGKGDSKSSELETEPLLCGSSFRITILSIKEGGSGLY